jgi:hypothetical protein
MWDAELAFLVAIDIVEQSVVHLRQICPTTESPPGNLFGVWPAENDTC